MRVPRSIHLVCGHDERGQPNNVTYDAHARAFWSGRWALTQEEAAELVGGWLYLHVTKASPSYFGGPVVDFGTVDVPELARSERILLRFEPAQTARGRPWRGRHHGRAWTGGLVDATALHEASGIPDTRPNRSSA